MPKIKEINASILKDSLRGQTIEVTVSTDNDVLATDSVPTGISTGRHEAKPVLATEGVKKINQIIKPRLAGTEVTSQALIDQLLIDLDGTTTKSHLGANSMLAVSLACARAAAKTQSLPLYRFIANLVKTSPKIPTPLMVMIEGGKHGLGNPLTYQEFLVADRVSEGGRILKKLQNRFDEEGVRWNFGSEGGLAPFVPSNVAALDLLESVKGTARIGLDIAASHLKSTALNLIDLVNRYHIAYLEDPFGDEDWSAWSSLTKSLSSQVLVVGDDLTTTNISRLRQAIDRQAANALIIKPNQIGTLSETLAVVRLANQAGWELIVSHRAGETMDDFITDLAVGIGARYLKAGAPDQPERMAKYQRLDAIAKDLKEYV